MKKVLAIVLCVAMLAALGVSLVACNDTADFKVGFICLHDENSTYDKNFIDAIYEAQKALGLKDDQIIIKTNVPEGNECYVAAADLVDQGCKIVFANSFGHESYMLQAAKDFPEVQFCHATGTMAHDANVSNFQNAFASIYEGRYLAGVAAGYKLQELVNGGAAAKIGYVGAFPYAEVVSGYTSFYLGVKSVVSNVTMEVQFTNSWYDETAEKNAANNLIQRGAVLISQHADSWGAPTACEQANVPNVSYNGSTISNCPNTYIISSRINWAPYYEYMIKCVQNGEDIAADWTGTIATNSVLLTDLNANAYADAATATAAQNAINTAKAALQNGTLEVFDCDTFTVGGAALSTYMADVNTDSAFTPDTQVIENGAFEESSKRSAPYFDVRIDGITCLN
ncbi:MAG: BMP family ABC transporter substrate-binding protein [Clostridia bacterium]|nr:BMP family ABC transporter substrate-binding protein [Clostridia bacterium]